MTQSSVVTIVRALNEAGVRYLIAGGLAAVAHGVVRFTADVDLVLALDDDNLSRAIASLASLGFAPRVPVPFEALLDRAQRERWIAAKGMTVFSVSSPRHPLTEVDLFVRMPFEFEVAYANALRLELPTGVIATFVGRDDLIRMKRAAGRPRDLEDVRALESLGDPDPPELGGEG
ncbi:MAG: hypothetical protein U0527_00645 [Candidatus Eisenbacteria bacterium]